MSLLSFLSFFTDNWLAITAVLGILAATTAIVVFKTQIGIVAGNKQIIVWGLTAAFVVGGLVFFKDTLGDVKRLKQENATLVEQNKQIAEANVKLQDVIATQNKAVEELSRNYGVIASQFKTLNGKVDKQTTTITTNIQQILKEPKPQDCQSAIQYLIDAAKPGAQR